MAKSKKQEKEEAPTVILDLPGDSKEARLQAMYNDWYKCQRCELKEWRCTEAGKPIDDVVFCSGNPNADIMIVGEAPGEEEVNAMVPFVGRSGQLLNQILATVSTDPNIKSLHSWYTKVAHTDANKKKFHEEMFAWRGEKFFFANVVACRPPENRAPTPPEIEACMPRLQNIVYTVDPVLIISSGAIASTSLIGHKIQVTNKRGEVFDMQLKGKVSSLTYPVVVTLHPSYLLRKADWNVNTGEYSKTIGDFSKAMKIAEFLKDQKGAA